MNEQLMSIIQITYTTLLPLILAYVCKNIKDIRESKNIGKEADMLILRLILIDLHDAYIRQGYVTTQGFVTFNEFWTLYHDGFSGNHLTEKFKKEVEALPIRPDSWEEDENE